MMSNDSSKFLLSLTFALKIPLFKKNSFCEKKITKRHCRPTYNGLIVVCYSFSFSLLI